MNRINEATFLLFKSDKKTDEGRLKGEGGHEKQFFLA